MYIMSTIRLTPYNVQQYIGHDIVFIHNNNQIMRRILSVSSGRKTIKIEYPPLQNNLQIVSRNIRVVL
jgi:hypothetical protein